MPSRLSFIAIVCLALFPALALAHAMGVEVRLKNNQIYIETFFHDDSPASNALVTIENEAGEKILSEKTDKEGKLQAPAPLPGKYKILVNDGAGHLSSTPLIIPKLNPADTNNQNILVSKSPDRNQFIQTPWLGIVVGLATIAALGFIASRLYQNPKSNS
ncbi:MAG: carboxypeptidase regulatory-like domain-containing protein [Planctomycetia bacterium]|nr:carboxypeptidase-like regulatory domain-containing protein [Gemmataceae bacterium]NBT62178.1 carboxypeptidase regulatory-like domain-containing protein [Planctomycetia bacterium]